MSCTTRNEAPPKRAMRERTRSGRHAWRRQELTIRRNERHGELLLAHALRFVAHRRHERPRGCVHPAEVRGVENDAGGVAVAPMDLAREASVIEANSFTDGL